MDRLCGYVRNIVVNFKLDSCLCVAPIRAGLLCIGYFNIFVSLLFLVATADEVFSPPLMSVQLMILEDSYSKPLCIVAYGTEMAFNMLLLSGVYRNDVTLLRVYIYFVIASIVSSVQVYSIVFIKIPLLTQLLIILILVFQCYVIVLVWSRIVEIRQTRDAEKNGHVTLYSVVQMPEDMPAKSDQDSVANIANEHKSAVDVEVSNTEPKTTDNQDSKKLHEDNDEDIHCEQKDVPPSKLATINEQIKEN